jgi:hypothetical protein
MIDGRAYSWQQVCELRRQQKQAREAARATQLALFELQTDIRPHDQRTASGRYQQPILFDRHR